MPEKKIDSEMKLEDALRRLDEVLKELDKDSSDLDRSLKLYEEGVSLVRICNERLSAADRKIKMLKMSADGEISEVDFEGNATGEKK